jgi:hypothetical protein
MTNLPPDPISAEHAELAARLRALGRTPVDPIVASAHFSAMAKVRTGSRPHPARGRFGRAKIAAAFAAGLVLGSTGLASAGALGNTPQNAVANAAVHVGLDLPGGTARSTDGCDGKTYPNHGAFVSQGGDPHSPCGKPLKSTGKPDKSTNKPDSPDPTDKTPDANTPKGCGKPPWAGKGNQAKKTPAAVDARRAACSDDSTDAAPGGGAAAPKAPTTTTTTTTTTTPPTATTTTTSAPPSTTAPTTTTTLTP